MKLFYNKITPFLIVVFFTINLCYSQSPSNITITTKSKLKKINPGEHYTVLFEISNKLDKDAQLNLEYNLPLGFKPLLASKNKTIPSLGKKNVIFSFTVEKYTKAKNYSIQIIAKNNNIIVAKYKLLIEVSKIYKLDIIPVKFPEYLRFEKEFTCEYTITNKGNSEEKINLESIQSISIVPSFINLKPDSTAVVKVVQAVPLSPFSKGLALNVLKANISSVEETFSSRVPITVYPNSIKKPDLYYRYPINVSTGYNYLDGTETTQAFKFKVNGAGFIDRNKNNYLSFYYSGPNQPELIRFGEYDDYNILYKTKKMELSGGNVSYSLTNISESSRSGLGGVFKYFSTKSNVTLFYLEPRFTKKISESFGGDVEWFTSKKTFIKFGLILREITENDELLNSQIYSLSSGYSNNFLKLKGEIAFESNNLTNGFASELEVDYTKNKFQWGNTVQYSDKDFKGYLRNSKLFLSNVSYQFSKKIKTQLRATFTSINPEQDSINYNSSPIVSYYNSNIYYRLNKNNKFKIGASYRKKEDRLEIKSYYFEEQLVNLNYSYQKRGGYNVQFSNSYGTTKNLLLENSVVDPTFYSTLEFSFYMLKNLSTTVSGNYEYTSRNSSNGEITSSIYYGANLQYQLQNKLNLNLFYRSDYAIDELESDAQSYLQAELQYNFNKNNKFSLSASQTSIPLQNNSKNKELLISASYNFTINAPLSKDKTKGIIKGKIISTDNDNLEGILISVDNKAAVTNKKGEFVFYNLLPNDYLLSIAQSSLPKNKIVLETTPMIIDVVPNKETLINLTLGKTGGLDGVVNLKKLSSLRSDKFEKKLPRVIVKIYNEDKKFLTQTNNNGEFKFAKLIPGEWTVELLVKKLTKDFTFTLTKQIITIKPDSDSFVEFKAAVKNRTLKKSKKTFKL